jgi:hypothetical protein
VPIVRNIRPSPSKTSVGAAKLGNRGPMRRSRTVFVDRSASIQPSASWIRCTLSSQAIKASGTGLAPGRIVAPSPTNARRDAFNQAYRCDIARQHRCTAVALNPATVDAPTVIRSSRTDLAVTAATIGVPLTSTVTRVNAPAGTISMTRPRNWFCTDDIDGSEDSETSSARITAWVGPGTTSPSA